MEGVENSVCLLGWTTVALLMSCVHHVYNMPVGWLSRGPDSSGEVWIGCKKFILKLSDILSVKEVEGPYM
jgi:hypothetical protein